MNYRLTIDKDLMERVPPMKGITILKRWKTEGRLDLVEAEPSLKTRQASMSPIVPWSFTNYRKQSKILSRAASEKIIFSKFARILFPICNSSKLNMTEINDVVHLTLHSQRGNGLFVTGNANLIDGGRRDRLASVGVIIMTPDEAVSSLSQSEGWE